jgi:hypothetical protein
MTEINARWIKKDDESLDADPVNSNLMVKCAPEGPIERYITGIRIKNKGIANEHLSDEVKQTTVASNILSDTKYFKGVCDGEIETSKDIITAFKYPWDQVGFINGTTGAGTVRIINLSQLDTYQVEFDEDLDKATPQSFINADFRVLLLDVEITANQSDGSTGMISLLSQGNYNFSGYNRGEFPIQISAFVNVVSVTGNIQLHLLENITSNYLSITSDLIDSGWQYLTHIDTKFRRSIKSYFVGIGRMVVGIALPYAGIGYHNKKYVYANSLGRYMFDYDLMPNGFTFNYSKGYNLGISSGNTDGYDNNTYDDDTDELNIETITGFQVGYKAGYTQGKNQKILYDTGYSDGDTQGDNDCTGTDPFDDSTANTNIFYINGYEAGYLNGWTTAGCTPP